MQLEAQPSVRVRVVDRAGKPLAGATLAIDRFDTDYTKVLSALERVRGSLGYNLLSESLWRRPTGADGETVVHFLPLANTAIRLIALHPQGQDRSEPFTLEPGEGDAVTVVRIER